MIARRASGQKKWGKSEKIPGAHNHSMGNPVLFQEPNGQIWLFFVLLKGIYWTDAILKAVYSEDEGHTWSKPIQMWNEKGFMVKHPPVLLHNGSLLLPTYDEAKHETLLLTSFSPYSNWQEAYRFSGLQLIQSVFVRQSKSRLGLFFRPWTEPRRIWRSHSENEGLTWSVPIRTSLPNPLSGIGALMIKEQIALVYNPTDNQQRYPLSISLSGDGGVSWGKPWHLEEIPYEVSYPSFLRGKNGHIHGVYSYNRRMIKYVSFGEEDFFSAYEQNQRV